ncbi:hypothetical protein M885DRAFT_541239 [Pelagophyceae sp. CCMP2097]|nr:hypothetical protein M885DRAFT_541239 [Pelagophyceae sp. CCMP2097]
MRGLGDRYVAKEFRDHRTTTDVNVLYRFQHSWRLYLAQLQKQHGAFGEDLSDDAIAGMSDDQRTKLMDLKQSTNERG